jgi:hypothetical protein
MAEKSTSSRKVSDKSTKQEMLEAYSVLQRQLDEQRSASLNPEKKLEEKRVEEAVRTAVEISPEGVDRGIGNLKAEIGRMLAQLSDQLAAESNRFSQVQKAIAAKEKELQELYGIEKAATSLAALLEAQNQKRREFEVELAEQKAELATEIEQTRAEWEKEKLAHNFELKERDTLEKKARDREKEEFTYGFKRDQQAWRDQFNDEKVKLEKEILIKKETAAKELAEREKAVVDREKELAELRSKVAAFPKELETTVAKAVQEATDRIQLEARNKEQLLGKEFEGKQNVLTTRITSLESTVKEQADQLGRATKQLELAYQKVQEIAEKAIEGSSQSKALAELQRFMAEQTRKTASEKA